MSQQLSPQEVLSPFTDASALSLVDKFLLQGVATVDNAEQYTAIRVPLQIVRAYFTQNLIAVDENGHLIINGQDTGHVVVGVTPLLRHGTLGIEVSYDNGTTWTVLVTWDDLGINDCLKTITEEQFNAIFD